MEKKITKKEMFAKIKEAVADNAEMVAFIDHEIELLNKNNSAEGKPTTNQLDNVKIKKLIRENIGANRYTITEMIKTLLKDTEWAEITCSRLTAICTQMVEEGDLVREVDKRKAYYRAV